MKIFKGFTLIELMIAIAMFAILIAVGVPNFRASIQNNRIITNANGLISAMMIARSEAIKRSVNVRIMSISGNQNWTNGWTVITDNNNDNIYSIATADCNGSNDCEVYKTTGLGSGVTLNSVVNNVAFFEFDPRGRLRTPPSQLDALVMCDGRGFVQEARAIIVTTTGRSAVVPATDPAADVNGNVNSCT